MNKSSLVSLLVGSFITFQSAFAASLPSRGTIQGVDQNGQSCGVTLRSVRAGATSLASSCDFEQDGVGPWCSTEKNVPVRDVQAAGTFSTAAGETDFGLYEQEVRFDGESLGLAAKAKQGGTLVLTYGGSHLLVASYDFVTDYGYSLSPDQRNAEIMNRASGVSYEDAYHRIYANITCTAQ